MWVHVLAKCLQKKQTHFISLLVVWKLRSASTFLFFFFYPAPPLWLSFKKSRWQSMSVQPTVWRCSLYKSPCCYCPDISMHLCASSAVGWMWHTGSGSVALSDPGKLCHPVIIPSLPVCCQPAHRGGGHHHGDRLSGLCWSCQRESSSAADGKSFWRRAVDLKTPWHWRRCNVLKLMLSFSEKQFWKFDNLKQHELW